MNKAVYSVRFKDGVPLHINNDGGDFLATCEKWEGKSGYLTIDVSTSKSNRQNRYFRGVVVLHFLKALRQAGYNEIATEKEALDVMKGMFFQDDRIKIGSTEYPRYLSTSNADWDTETWENKMQYIRQWTSEKLKYMIPLPNEGEYE